MGNCQVILKLKVLTWLIKWLLVTGHGKWIMKGCYEGLLMQCTYITYVHYLIYPQILE